MRKDSINPVDVISYLTEQDAHALNSENFLNFIDFQPKKQRATMVDALAIEMYAGIYILHQLARLAKDHNVVMVDGKRRSFPTSSKKKENCQRPFYFLHELEFSGGRLTAIVLNHPKCPSLSGANTYQPCRMMWILFFRKYVPIRNSSPSSKRPHSTVITEFLKILKIHPQKRVFRIQAH
jgi:hypothetical protein